MPNASLASAVSLFDGRPFFEKALLYGVKHGLLDQAKLSAIAEEAPKGMVQIARYFGSEFLRPELELARERLVNLVSLHLEDTSLGDLSIAAGLLREHTFLSRSKAGSDMLKALIVMPQNTHFGMNERGGFADRHIPQLARWSLASYAEYRKEFASRQRAALVVDAALWLAVHFGLGADELQDAEPDAEAVIRTSLLMQAVRRQQLPDWVLFEKMVLTLRKNEAAAVAAKISLPTGLPGQFTAVVESVRQSVLSDLPRLLDPRLPVRQLFDQTPAFMGRYFWIEDALSEINEHDRARSATWQKLIQGHGDDSTLLTLFLCVAASTTAKTLLTEKAAASLVRKIRKDGLQVQLALAFIKTHAPEQHQQDYSRLWLEFVEEAQSTLTSDRDSKLTEAMSLLRRECNVA
ncbi:MAG: hypothetical protein KAX57_15200 [Rhodoferax sp.]|jgi:hypothetical protein|uniref:hypothetical protein n=1 Tax=Rhodoferax sp. TaxID=50421 RepID=UPI001B3D03DE|nr:hypothetical protein [Rhodoferax sp.]MBP8288169.1 hypothetical protein [Rhodoferax sp.]MBP9736401.1 hypothetical protein [Rhodoferax sp.]